MNDAPSMKGLCWVAGDSIAAHNMDHVLSIGANWISQTPFGWMSGINSPEVVLNSDRAWWGERDKGIRHTAEHAREAGIKTMLKPHIWLRRSGDKWRSDIAMDSAEDWDKWFESYTQWILHYARLAEECQIESLCIGTELYQTTVRFPDRWRAIIRSIREIYSGELTYAANWYKEYEAITFWDELDYIGVQAYFPLAKKDRPEKNELLASWSKHKKRLKKIADRYHKKIIFTEIGYKNTADAAKEPWTWPQSMDEDTGISAEMQRLCYEAMFESLWKEPWFDGLFIWKWFHTSYAHEDFNAYFEARAERRKEWAKRRNRQPGPPVFFSPQQTEALQTLTEWYGGKGLE